MSKKRRAIKAISLIIMVFVIVITSVLPVQAKGKVKLKNSKVTLTVGQSKTLKVLNTKKKIKWTTSNKKVATVSKKGKVKAKKKGNCKIYARVGKKKLTCKVTVKPKKKAKKKTTANNNNNTYTNNVTWRSYGTNDGVVILVKNNYSYTVGVDVDCLFYDSNGKLLEKGSDSNYALESGYECALFAWNPNSNWTSHKINLKVLDAKNVVANASKINMAFNVGNENVMIQAKNNGIKVFSTEIAVVYYKNNRVIGYGRRYPEVSNPGAIDYLEIPFPYDSDYNAITPDRYVVYVNHSYTYNWMK